MAAGDSTVRLVERIRQADPSAEEALVHRFYQRVCTMAMVKTGDREAARDLAQEIMLAVLRALREGRLHDETGLAGYVCATARNRINHFLRTRHVERNVDPPPTSVLNHLDPEKCFGDAERRRQAERAIERLSPADREILRLTLVEGLQPKQIAARLQLKPEVVRKRRSRAVRRARKAIRKERVTKPAAELLINEGSS
jgi:RNA polymerase sigma-70 factor (ECF subfamily)